MLELAAGRVGKIVQKRVQGSLFAEVEYDIHAHVPGVGARIENSGASQERYGFQGIIRAKALLQDIG